MPAKRSRPDESDAAATVVHGEALEVLSTLPDGCAGLVYVDPPFNTGGPRRDRAPGRRRTRSRRGSVSRAVTIGRSERTARGSTIVSTITSDGCGRGSSRHGESSRPTAASISTSTLTRSHYCKVLLDEIFGRASFLNEVVWAYDYGARTKRRWPAKHDVILVYVRDPERYHFDASEVTREPYMAPRLQTPERAALGKLPTGCLVAHHRADDIARSTGYPTPKPLGILRRIVVASSRPGDLVVDWCAGSGTTGVAAAELGRRFLLVDDQADAIAVMRSRLAGVPGLEIVTR